MKYTRSKKILSLALTLLMLGGTVTSSFANVESLKNQKLILVMKNMDLS